MAYYDDLAKGYNELHRAEQEKKLRIIAEHISITPYTTLLDVGCDTGISTAFWKCHAIGIDQSHGLIEIARDTYSGIHFIEGKAESLPFGDDAFDVVISVTALQNVEDVQQAVAEIHRVAVQDAAITFLRKSGKREAIDAAIGSLFAIRHRIEEEKDIICICEKKPLA
ncbi:TPA: methyltransferase domain-containing protein [Candidatus Woesearchaeota archaeon]|nr:methyltransferase domain-containing protein [Candidatus Woesearchaeota archaeon]